jgi:hypothetical protein
MLTLDGLKQISKLFGLPRLAELRWLGKRRVSLVTNDSAVIVDALAAPAVQCLDVYIVVNQPVGDLVSRRGMPRDTLYSPLRGQCTADADIERRLLLPFDFDPIRPTGLAATLAQVQLAVDMRDRVVEYLADHGFPDPADVFSGNGRHLYYAADLPNTPEVSLLLESLYHSLAREFDQLGVKVDQSVRSAAQLMRFPGSFNFKAQRTSEILNVPKSFVPVSLETIQAVVDELQNKHRTTPGVGHRCKIVVGREGGWCSERMSALLDFHNVDYRGPTAVPQGLLWILLPCVFNPDHGSTSPAVLVTKKGWPKFVCKHDSCVKKRWTHFLAHLNLTNRKVYTWKS